MNYFIIIAVVFIPFLDLIDRKIKKERINWTNIGVLILALSICFVSIYKEFKDSQEETYKSYSGKMNNNIKSNIIKNPMISIGGAKIMLDSKSGANTLFNLGDDKIDIWIENNKLFLSLTLRDKHGNVVARIENSEWVINENKIFDRNFDNHGLEVIDEQGVVILQLDFDGEKVNFAGKLHRKDGTGVAFGYAPNNEGGIIEKKDDPNKDFELDIAPIFKYPSNLHMGERLKDNH